MDRRKLVIGFLVIFCGIFLIAKNPESVTTGCWGSEGCKDYYSGWLVWEYGRGFSTMAWVGTLLNGIGSVIVGRAAVGEKGGTMLVIFFITLTFCFMMACSFLTLSDVLQN